MCCGIFLFVEHLLPLWPQSNTFDWVHCQIITLFVVYYLPQSTCGHMMAIFVNLWTCDLVYLCICVFVYLCTCVFVCCTSPYYLLPVDPWPHDGHKTEGGTDPGVPPKIYWAYAWKTLRFSWALPEVHVYHIIYIEIMLDFVFRKLFDFMHCLIPAVVAIVTNETRMNWDDDDDHNINWNNNNDDDDDNEKQWWWRL